VSGLTIWSEILQLRPDRQNHRVIPKIKWRFLDIHVHARLLKFDYKRLKFDPIPDAERVVKFYPIVKFCIYSVAKMLYHIFTGWMTQ